jgi:hypothetical protein
MKEELEKTKHQIQPFGGPRRGWGAELKLHLLLDTSGMDDHITGQPKHFVAQILIKVALLVVLNPLHTIIVP